MLVIKVNVMHALCTFKTPLFCLHLDSDPVKLFTPSLNIFIHKSWERTDAFIEYAWDHPRSRKFWPTIQGNKSFYINFWPCWRRLKAARCLCWSNFGEFIVLFKSWAGQWPSQLTTDKFHCYCLSNFLLFVLK